MRIATDRHRGPIQSAAWLCLACLGLALAACRNDPSPPTLAEPVAAAESADEVLAVPLPSHALPPEAAALVERLADSYPADVEAFHGWGQIAELYGQSDTAAWCWKKCLELNPGFSPAHERLGMTAANQGNFEEAVEHLKQACALDPESPQRQLQLGKTLINLGRYPEAVEVLKSDVARHPDIAESWFRLGQACFKLQDYVEARRAFGSALSIDSNFPPAWNGMSQVCERLGEVEEAQECRVRFLELEKTRRTQVWTQRRLTVDTMDSQILARAYGFAGDVDFLHGNQEEAKTCWRRAAELDATNAYCRGALARQLARENHTTEALALLEELQRLEPWNLEHPFRAAMLHLQLQQIEAAERLLQRIVQLSPGNVAAAIELARLSLTTGRRLPESQRLAERVVRLQPTAENYFLLGSLCLANEDRGGAQAALHEALRLDPNNPRYAAAASLIEKE